MKELVFAQRRIIIIVFTNLHFTFVIDLTNNKYIPSN